MSPSLVHLPNGQTLTVSPVFGGLFFKSGDLNLHHSVVPPGWTIILNCADDEEDDPNSTPATNTHSSNEGTPANGDHHAIAKKPHVYRFRKPTLRNDHLYISSISNPSSSDFRPAVSATRQIAMMLWATLWWYFHQPEPSNRLTTPASEHTPDDGKPKGDWRVNINREGILKGKHLLPKLERMGLISSEDSTVGLDPEDGVSTSGEGWSRMFVSRRSFWQLDPRIYLFTLTPASHHPSPFPSLSPANSRPASPTRNSLAAVARADDPTSTSLALQGRSVTPPGPYSSNSHLPTFYPPPPLQYTFTSTGVRYPIRPKPPRQGETFYTRFIPSLGQYLSFRVASLSGKPCPHVGPTSSTTTTTTTPQETGAHGLARDLPRVAANPASPPPPQTSPPAASSATTAQDATDTLALSDVDLLHRWMNDPRVAAAWGEQGPREKQEAFLRQGLGSRHSFPVIGCFDGRPFAYFEIYWVKEDRLAALLGGECGEWDRGLHCLVGEREFRGPHRVRVWMSALVHYALLADSRTSAVVLEPRVDNVKLRKYCEDVGFFKEREVAFPHKQSNLMKFRRESWEGPAL